MIKRKTFQQWEAEQRARNPHWDRENRIFARIHGPKRRIHFLSDENIEDDLMAAVGRRRHSFKCSRATPGMDDDAIWRLARRQRRVLLTSDDSDFWNDHKFPVQLSPGLVILRGQSATDKLASFERIIRDWSLVEHYRRVGPEFLYHMKIKGSGSGTYAKWWDGGSLVQLET